MNNGYCFKCQGDPFMTDPEHTHTVKLSYTPIPMLLWCPECGERHIDVDAFKLKGHHTHACQHCGHCWRPAIVPTVGVQFLPGFKNQPGDGEAGR